MMRVLLTESAPGAADDPERQLREAGYDVSFCHPDHTAEEVAGSASACPGPSRS
jgi:hypothetical protein